MGWGTQNVKYTHTTEQHCPPRAKPTWEGGEGGPAGERVCRLS